MKDAIGVFKLKPFFFQSAIILRLFPPLYLPFWTHKHNQENNPETCFWGIQSFFSGSNSHDWLFEDYCWFELALKLVGLNPPNTQIFTEIQSWFESAVRVGREMKVWTLPIYNLPLRSEVLTTIQTISTEIWNLDSNDQSPAIYRHPSPILGAKSGFWEQYLHHPTLLMVSFLQEERFWNSCFFCKHRKMPNRFVPNDHQTSLGPHVEAEFLHGFASPDCGAEYY